MLATEGAGGGGDASPAVAALGRVLLATHARLAAAADGSGPPALFPRFHMKLDDKLAGALGKGKADPKWAAHFGLDGTHPVPAGCPGGDVPGGGSDGGHNHSAHSGGGHAVAAADTLSEPITAQRRAAPSSSASARRLVPGLAPGVVRPRPGAKAAAAAKAPAGRRGLRQDHEHEHEHEEKEEGGGHDDAAHDHGGHGACRSMTGHTMVHKLWTSKAFINYQPCVLQEMAHGVHAGATGLRFAPRLLDLMPTGLMAGIQGLNLNPSLIYFAPMGLNVQCVLRFCVLCFVGWERERKRERSRAERRARARARAHGRAHHHPTTLSPPLSLPPSPTGRRASTCSRAWSTSAPWDSTCSPRASTCSRPG